MLSVRHFYTVSASRQYLSGDRGRFTYLSSVSKAISSELCQQCRSFTRGTKRVLLAKRSRRRTGPVRRRATDTGDGRSADGRARLRGPTYTHKTTSLIYTFIRGYHVGQLGPRFSAVVYWNCLRYLRIYKKSVPGIGNIGKHYCRVEDKVCCAVNSPLSGRCEAVSAAALVAA